MVTLSQDRCGIFHLCHVMARYILDFGTFQILDLEVGDGQPMSAKISISVLVKAGWKRTHDPIRST